MVSSGARLGDHGDDMSRSMMGSQLERGNSSTREGGPRRTGALAASQLGGLSRHVIVVKRRDVVRHSLQKDGRSKGPDCQIQQYIYIQDIATSRKVCMTASSHVVSCQSHLQTQPLPRSL